MEQAQPSNRPPGDDFHQQKLKAWQPILTPWHVITLFVAIGVAFIPTGVHLLNTSNDVRIYQYLSLPFILSFLSFFRFFRFMNPLSFMTDLMLLLIAQSTTRTKEHTVR